MIILNSVQAVVEHDVRVCKLSDSIHGPTPPCRFHLLLLPTGGFKPEFEKLVQGVQSFSCEICQ